MTEIKDIPRYQVLELIGEGALASVHKVRSLKDGSIRALKVLKPERAQDDRTVARFEDEYRILSALHHPSLPEVYDYGVASDGTPFIVMEYLEGIPLDEYVGDHPDDLWLLLFQLNEALAFIHEHNLLHLDLKPSNVLVRRTKIFGEEETPLAVLIDFGLSYRRDTGGKVKLVGTPGYMAPEIIRGEENLTRAVDYYSLGVIMYEIVEGRLPFRGSVHDILRGQLSEKVTFERQKVEYAELYPWIEKLMSKEPRVRLESFGEFRRAVAARLGEATVNMERVFALGYIDSLGLVGKEEAWEELHAWASKVAEGLLSRRKRGDGGSVPDIQEHVDMPSGSDVPPVARPADVLKGSVTNLEKRIEEDLLASAASARPREDAGPIDGVARVLAVSGPPESGKSHILSVFRSELRVRGIHVVSLGEDSDYETLVRNGGADVPRGKRGRPVEVDPSSLVIDRFVAVWNQLAEMGRETGVVIIVDDLARVSVEEKEFLEYVGKRMGHHLAEKKESGMFVVVVGPAREVKKVLLPAAAKEGALATIEVPPPGKRDADGIAASFRGRLSGVAEEKSLASFLQANLQSSAALYQAIKQAVGEEHLVFRHGKWEFYERMAKPLERGTKAGSYHTRIVGDLSGRAREVVAFLACHPSGLMVDDLARISGLSVTELNETIETIRPYRIIEVADAERGRRLDVISEEVRNALRAGFKKGEKERIHRSFIEYLSQNPGDNVDYFEVMGWHYKELGRVRDSLLMSVRAIALARKDRDPFALRQYCRSEIAYIRNMSRPRSVVDTWLIERYFIKQWINAEWMVANYRNLVGVIDEHLIHRKRQVPASFLYKYAMALERIGKPERCRKVLGDGERRLAPARSETYYMLLLQDARMLCHAGMCEQSLERLDAINRDVLAPVARARLFVTYVHDYQELGQEDRWVEYIEKADRLPRVPGLIDELLRVEYSKIRRMLTKGVYGPTIKMIRNGIRVAAKYRAKRSMCSMYFIASALYYESGDYRRAIKFLDKAIHVGKENVFPEWTYEWVLRYAYIYRQLGLYGNAVEKVESVTRAVGTDRGHLQYLSSLTALLELFVMINSVRAEEVFPEVVRAARKVQSQMRLAFYHRALARYYAKKSDIDRAISEFETARKLFSMTKMIDEEVSAGIAIASLLIAQNRLESANQFLHDLKPFCERIESKKIQAEFSILELKYCVAGGVEQRRIEHCIERCEKLRSQTRDVTLSMAIDAELFAALARIGNLVRASEVFDRYYGELRYIVGNLPGEYVGDFVRDPRLIAIIESYRHLKTQDPGRRY